MTIDLDDHERALVQAAVDEMVVQVQKSVTKELLEVSEEVEDSPFTRIMALEIIRQSFLMAADALEAEIKILNEPEVVQ